MPESRTKEDPMLARAIGMAIFLAAGALAAGALPADAYVGNRSAGPTRTFTVPKAQVLPYRNYLMSTTLFSGSGIGPVLLPISGNLGILLNQAADFRIQSGFWHDVQIDFALSGWATAPGQSAIDLVGKWVLIDERDGAIASVAALAGTMGLFDFNGQVRFGNQVGFPVTKQIALNERNILDLTLYPAWVSGLGLPGGLALGAGLDMTITSNLRLIADTDVPLPGMTGVGTRSNVGFRYALPGFVADFFLGLQPGPTGPIDVPLGGGFLPFPAAVGFSGHWNF